MGKQLSRKELLRRLEVLRDDNKKKTVTINHLCDQLSKQTTLEKLFVSHLIWAGGEFPDSTPRSSLKGLLREIKEVEREIKKLEPVADMDNDLSPLALEYVDCFMYLLDSFQRAGFCLDDLKEYFEEKLKINKDRKWKKNRDNSYSHK